MKIRRCIVLAAATMYCGVVAHADLLVLITESGDETVQQLKIGTVEICGYTGKPKCVIPIPIDTSVFNSNLDDSYVIPETGGGTSDSFIIQKGFPGQPDFHGMTGFSSPGGNDMSAADTETKTFDKNPKVIVTITSPCEGNGKALSNSDDEVCQATIPEPSTRVLLSLGMLILIAIASVMRNRRAA